MVCPAFPGSISINSNGDIPTCEILNVAPVQNLTVKWYKDNELFQTNRFNSSSPGPVNISSPLKYKPTSEDNGVNFRCEAYLDLSPEGPQFNRASEEYTIDIQFGPEMECSNVEIEEGDTLESRCPVRGNPIPFVIWHKNGQPTNSSIPLSRYDAGTYEVKTEGFPVFGKVVEVHVLYGPELTCADNYTAFEHTPLYLTCKVMGFPKPKITWYKDGIEVELPENFTRSDAGQYTVTASNNNDNVSHTLEIIVLYPPSQILELEDSESTVGSSVSLKCSANGNPKPQYSWIYYQTTNVLEENEDGVSRLVIQNATVYNMGNYTCRAWNERGDVSKTSRLTIKGAKQECPLQITPERMVLEYRGGNQSATCKALTTTSTNIDEIYWEDDRGKNISLEWVADTHNWDLRPVCTAKFKGIGICQKTLDVTFYKKPDSVSLSIEADNNTLMEGSEYSLVCEIISVAPAQNVRVRWYRGNESFTPADVSCDMFNVNTTKRDVNMLFRTNITANRKLNGLEFTCEAELDLRPGEPQLLSIMSQPLNITVHYKPSINTTKLQNKVPVISGYTEDLICEADGNPPPMILWISSSKIVTRGSEVLHVTEAGTYNCNATNYVGSISREVEVILKVDYLPLIAGFVAVTVVAISIMFVFIYSIYYKNTKMRRYNLKKPKLNTHNGNVAHNGWDM